MESRAIKLTKAAFDYGNLNIRPCGHEFFPEGIFGGATSDSPGEKISIEAVGLSDIIKTDIPTYDGPKKPRWIFRERAWVKKFVHIHKLKPGDFVILSRIDNKTYKAIPGNGAAEMVAEVATLKKKHKKEKNQLHELRNTKLLDIAYVRTCNCPKTHINCLTPKEWLKCQLGVWRFTYEGRDVRDKTVHPATFPIALAHKIIKLFSHKGELVLDPFVGSGTTLLAAQDLGRNGVGFDLQEKYIKLTESRLAKNAQLFSDAKQIAVCDNASNISQYLPNESISLIFTSPPYANLLNRHRKNKSRRNRNNEQLGKIEQYSQDPRDLGTMPLKEYTEKMGDIFEQLLPIMRSKTHCVINVPDMWWENHRVTIHVSLIEELRRRGYELRNVIIWDRTNLVNQIGIFGWPSNYITMGVTFEYLLDFWKPPKSTITKEIKDAASYKR
jgi:DNA modification methylase